jgi:hypothetical protein
MTPYLQGKNHGRQLKVFVTPRYFIYLFWWSDRVYRSRYMFCVNSSSTLIARLFIVGDGDTSPISLIWDRVAHAHILFWGHVVDSGRGRPYYYIFVLGTRRRYETQSLLFDTYCWDDSSSPFWNVLEFVWMSVVTNPSVWRSLTLISD